MRTNGASEINWRDPAAYASLLNADRSLFAWEWLRRDPAYCAAVEASACPSAFGLVAFEMPHRAVPCARPLWRAEDHSFVLAVEAVHGARNEAVAFDRLTKFTTLLEGDETDHLLLSDGLRTIRLDGPRGAFDSGAVCLRYRIEGLLMAGPLVLTLRRFLAVARAGRFAQSLHPVEARARRWTLLLRTFDALSDGASQREIAELLFGHSARAPRWRSLEPSLRSRVQRLVRSARAAAAGGYRDLLHHRHASPRR